MIDRFETFLLNITEIDLYLHRLTASEMKEFDVKGNCILYLTRLYRQPEGYTAMELANLCGRDKADVSRDMSVLISKGLIQKNGSAYRAKHVLTQAGRNLTAQIISKAEHAVEQVGSNISQEEREIFYKTLQVITTGLQLLSEEGINTREE